MTKYRKKPVEVEAFKFYVDAFPDWFTNAVTENKVILRNCNYGKYSIDEARCEIKTLEGTMVANGGDYIIKGIKGELYPCKSEIFEATYETVNGLSTIMVTLNVDEVVKRFTEKLEENLNDQGGLKCIEIH